MRAIVLAALLLAACATAPAEEAALARHYADAERFGYELTTHTFNNGQPRGVSRAISAHTVSGGVETIRWSHFYEGDADQSATALRVAPYTVSLAPGGALDLPRLDPPEMTGAITDLHTFYVAASQQLGVANLRRAGDSYAQPAPLTGDWADGADILIGADCTRATLTLIALDAETATLEAHFAPPAEACVTMAHDWMAPRVVESHPNNFQQVRVAGEGRLMAMWGLEEFTVRVVLDRASGLIRSGTMANTLRLKLKGGCDAALAVCQFETPLEIRRELELRLIP